MSKGPIKIIKKRSEPVSENSSPAQTEVETADSQIDAQRQTESVVKSWIDGRTANRRIEERAASDELVTWKMAMDDSEELS